MSMIISEVFINYHLKKNASFVKNWGKSPTLYNTKGKSRAWEGEAGVWGLKNYNEVNAIGLACKDLDIPCMLVYQCFFMYGETHDLYFH